MEAGVDLLSFDAFEFGETIAMYPDHVKRHLEEEKTLAWGVVPTGGGTPPTDGRFADRPLRENGEPPGGQGRRRSAAGA